MKGKIDVNCARMQPSYNCIALSSAIRRELIPEFIGSLLQLLALKAHFHSLQTEYRIVYIYSETRFRCGCCTSDKKHHQRTYSVATSSSSNAGLDTRNRLRPRIATN